MNLVHAESFNKVVGSGITICGCGAHLFRPISFPAPPQEPPGDQDMFPGGMFATSCQESLASCIANPFIEPGGYGSTGCSQFLMNRCVNKFVTDGERVSPGRSVVAP